jgi:hypothetical protein
MTNIQKRNTDRKRVVGGQEHEVKYEAHTIGTSKQEVRRVIEQAAAASRSRIG